MRNPPSYHYSYYNSYESSILSNDDEMYDWSRQTHTPSQRNGPLPYQSPSYENRRFFNHNGYFQQNYPQNAMIGQPRSLDYYQAPMPQNHENYATFDGVNLEQIEVKKEIKEPRYYNTEVKNKEKEKEQNGRNHHVTTWKKKSIPLIEIKEVDEEIRASSSLNKSSQPSEKKDILVPLRNRGSGDYNLFGSGEKENPSRRNRWRI